MDLTAEEQDEFFNMLFPHIAKRQNTLLKDKNKRFVHYCSADSALKILQSKKMWMRNTKCMNDISEVEHGFSCIRNILNEKDETSFFRVIEKNFSSIAPEIIWQFNDNVANLRRASFISCFSEHSVQNTLGKLSMWRAYGGNNGIAIVMKPEPFFNEDTYYNSIYTLPIIYGEKQFKLLIQEISKNILENKEQLEKIDKGIVINAFRFILMTLSLCTKHEGFEEELEWRVIYAPTIEYNENIQMNIEAIQGIPQHVCKLPMEAENVFNFNNLIEKIIIGPTAYPQVMYDAFIDVLTKSGIENSDDKVIYSNIPLRT